MAILHAGPTAARALALDPVLQSRLGAVIPNNRPFLIVVSGQSNAVGSGNGQDNFIDQTGGGVRITSSLTTAAGVTMVPAIYGTAPLNVDQVNGGTTVVAANIRGNIGPHIANEVRRLGIIPASRPIWIVVSAAGGIPIAQFVPVAGVRWIELAAAVANVAAIWTAQSGEATLPVELFHWQQGEADSTTAGPNNTFPAYLARWDELRVQLALLPGWTSATAITVGMMGVWPGYTTSDTAAPVTPSNARNDALVAIGSGRDATVQLVSSLGLPNNGTLVVDANHFSGASLAELGRRSAISYHGMRAGSAQRSLTDELGMPVTVGRRIIISGTARSLSLNEVMRPFSLDLAGTNTITMPAVGGNDAVFGFAEVATGTTTILPPSPGQLMNWILGLVSSIVLPIGIYQIAVLRGRWTFSPLLPQVGGYRMQARVNETPGALVNISVRESQGLVIGAFNNRIGLQGPTGGEEVVVILRSLTGGDTVIGRAVNSVGISAGGTGHVVGDVLTLALGAATGTAATVTVTAVAAGVITGVVILAGGCLTSTTLPATPAAPASSTGVGTGASLTTTYNAGVFHGPLVATISPVYTLTTVNQVVRLIGGSGQWRVISDSLV